MRSASRRTRRRRFASSSGAASISAWSKSALTGTGRGVSRGGRAKLSSEVMTLVRRSISATMKSLARRVAESASRGSPSATLWADERITASAFRASWAIAAASCPRAASFSACASLARTAATASICARIIAAASRSRRRASRTRPKRYPRTAKVTA
jgi:hypothetical protein